MTNELKPLFRPGVNVTGRATANVTGGRFVSVTAEYDGNVPVAHTGDGVKPFGVASCDIASGAIGSVLRGGILPVTAGATITAGQRVQSDGFGRAVPLSAGVDVGGAVENGTANAAVHVAIKV